MRTWKFYRAAAEQYREPNVFHGPLNIEDGDRFIHYVRQGKLGSGTDYFGIYCEDHAGWLKVQPKGLGLVEVVEKDVPLPNQLTELRAVKVLANRVVEDIGLAVPDVVEADMIPPHQWSV